jgi:hypothetical protein
MKIFSNDTKFVITALCVATHLAAQGTDSVRQAIPRIIGVYDVRTGEPLPGVQVRDGFSGTYATTSITGTARLDFITFRGLGAFVELRKLGYQPKQLLVTRGDTTPITEVLEPVPMLAPVVTTERYRIDRDAGRWDGFEQRCQSRSVTCYRGEDLEKKQSANIADVILRADGITITPCGRGRTRGAPCGTISMHPTVIPPSYCTPTFFVDGYDWDPRIGPAVDLAPGKPAEGPYTPTNVKAIEVYPPEKSRPLRFQGRDATCGVVVLWTK